ncbi:MAG: transcription elongation factor GreAB [Sphingobium sp. SCN 64-10]|nr:MAG: transcription elongation factor GreAB [Sphingobium sp. SCN 64-10]
MTMTHAARRPAIQMIDREADALTSLALGAEDKQPQVSALLLDEIARARVVRAERIPADTVTMGATVDFIDEASGTERTVKLVYPREADIAAGRVSILSLVGAGLIGLREGQAISWPDRSGRERQLRIRAVRKAG